MLLLLIVVVLDGYSQNIIFNYKNFNANIAAVKHILILKPLSAILNSPTRDTSQPQHTNISVYFPRINWFTNSAVFFTCSGLFWFCVENLLFLLMCCFSLPKYNLCGFEGHWILVEIGFNPDTILRNLVDLSLRWQLNNIGDLLGRCLSMHQYFQVYWLGLQRLIRLIRLSREVFSNVITTLIM